VAASRHPISHRQVTRVVAGSGTFCFWLPESADGAAAARLAADVRTVIQAGRPCVVAVEPGNGEEKPALVALLAQAIVAAMEDAPPAALIATGGETAFRMLAAARASGVDLGGEWRPGLPYGTVAGGPWHGLPLVTKAGGFGDEETLLDLVNALSRGGGS
jgi:uncharacterized protein YgbK (DUF1537 family)